MTKVAIVQRPPVLLDRAATLAKAVQWVAEAAREDASLIVFPESDPNYEAVTLQGRAYWRKWFGRDRQNRQKGRVWAKARGFR